MIVPNALTNNRTLAALSSQIPKTLIPSITDCRLGPSSKNTCIHLCCIPYGKKSYWKRMLTVSYKCALTRQQMLRNETIKDSPK